MPESNKPGPIGELLETSDLAQALDSDRFKLFLDQVPVAIAVAEVNGPESIVYANEAFGRIVGLSPSETAGKSWDALNTADTVTNEERLFSEAVVAGQDHLGVFSVGTAGKAVSVWCSLIEDDEGTPAFRLVAFVEAETGEDGGCEAIIEQLKEKDLLLRELQHRVKNNLQMITAMIRMEARNLSHESRHFDRLAGRVEALALLYQSLSEPGATEEVDLGVYLSQVASAVMRAHAVEGIRLDLKVDTWPVSINVAMPAGLAVNELMMNALKHAFRDRDGGTIVLHSLVDDSGCRVIVADDGVGLPPGMEWPQKGKLSSLIMQSLRQNAGAEVDVQSRPGSGMRVELRFSRSAAEA